MSGIQGLAAARSRLRILSGTLTVWREELLVVTARGRIVPVGGQNGAYAPVARAAEGQGGLTSSHLGLLEGGVDVVNGDEVHDGDDVYYCNGMTAWLGLTAVALERTR